MITLVAPARPNQCIVCGGNLRLIEIERSSYELNERGEKKEYLHEDFYDAYLKCDKCGSVLDVEKHGNRYCQKRILPEVKFGKPELKDFNPFQISL